MPRYLIERTFPDDGLIIPMNETGAKICHSLVSNNTQYQVTWIHSYIRKEAADRTW